MGFRFKSVNLEWFHVVRRLYLQNKFSHCLPYSWGQLESMTYVKGERDSVSLLNEMFSFDRFMFLQDIYIVTHIVYIVTHSRGYQTGL